MTLQQAWQAQALVSNVRCPIMPVLSSSMACPSAQDLSSQACNQTCRPLLPLLLVHLLRWLGSKLRSVSNHKEKSTCQNLPADRFSKAAASWFSVVQVCSAIWDGMYKLRSSSSLLPSCT